MSTTLAALALSFALGSARIALAEDAPPPPEPQRPLAPCRPSQGRVLPGPCSPDPSTPGDPSSPPPAGAEDRPFAAPDEERMPAERGHTQAEETLTSIVQRLDDFFGDPSHIQFDPPKARIRVRGGLRTAQDDPFDPEGSIIADLRLPSLDALLKRARIFVAGGEERDPARTGLEEDLVPRQFGPSASFRGGRGALELRFDLFRDKVTLVDAGAGVRFGWPPPPYLRLRAARAVELGYSVVAHGNQTLFWQRREGFGESTRADVERVFGPDTVARLWGIATIHELSRGLEWSGETGLQQALGKKTGVYLAAGIDGATRPAQVDRYRVFTRLRRDVYQGWLFAEIEPESAWPLKDDGARRPRVLAVTFRLEVQFITRKY